MVRRQHAGIQDRLRQAGRDRLPTARRATTPAAVVAGQLASVFNCPITLDLVDPTVYTAMVKDATTAPQYFMLGWCQTIRTQNWLFVMTSDTCTAHRLVNEEFDRLFAEANATADPDSAAGCTSRLRRSWSRTIRA